MVGAGLSAPTQSSAGIAANTAAPAASYVIGQEFKRRNAEGSLGHLLAHATLGGLTAAAGGNDPLTGALSSGGAEAAARYISGLFGQTDGSRLSAEQKETVRAIAGLIGTAAGAALGSTPADVAQGSLNAKNAVENNYLTEKELHAYAKEIMGCERSSNKQECLRNTDNKYYRIHLNHEQQFNNACHGAMMSQACSDQRGIVMDADHAWASSNIPGLPPSYNLTYSDIRDLGCQNNADCESRMRKYDQINVNSYNLRSNLLQERAAVVRGLTNTVFGQGSYERLSPDDQEMLESMLPDTFTGINGWRRPKAIRQSARNNMSNEGGTRSPASQESRRPNTASPSAAGQGKSGHTAPATPTQPNRQAQTGVAPNGNTMNAGLPNSKVIPGNGSKPMTPSRALPKPTVEHGGGNRPSTRERVQPNVTISSPGAAQRSVLDQVLAGNPGQSVPVPPGYQAIDLRTNQIVSEIVLDGKGFAGMEMKTGDAALARSQEVNYRAAIEGRAQSLGNNANKIRLENMTPRNIYLIRPIK